jgi:tetratricopeptide (TPR) repeat protein
MKHIILSVSLLFVSLAVLAQPSWVKKATKSVFTLKTFAADGSLLGSASGFYIGEKGEAVSSYTPFRGAATALVVDADGKEYAVECMLGASETYDIAKFRVGGLKKSASLKVAAGSTAVGSQVWVLPYRELRKVPQGKVLKAELFNTYYDYYTVEVEMPDNALGSPLMNEAGEVVGVMQPSAKRGDKQNYAVSACFADSLHITGLSINDPVLRAIPIKKALPEELDQAVLTLYVGAPSLDSARFASLVADFIGKFPSAPDGYQYRAQLHYSGNDFAAAQRDYEQALKVADKKDEVHYAYSRLIYQKEIYKSDKPYAEWSFDKAMQEAEEAYRINPQATYRHQQALIHFARKQYEEASQVYSELAASSLRSPELFYEASRCRQMLNDTTGQLALLDSAVAMFSRPLLKEAAPYILLRAQTRLLVNQYRGAVADLNDYESLMKTQVNDNFYYLRYQAEVGGRLYQQALNDLDRAISMRPDYDLYYAEKASLQIRVGLYDDALTTAKECVRVAPEFSDGYLFMGLAQCLKGQKKEGLKNLQKAKEMGDPQAESLIEKYSK